MEKTLRNIWLLNLSTFFFFLGISLTNPIVSPFAITLGASPFLVGLVAGVTSFVSLVSKPVGGLIGDRGYRLEMMIAGNVLSLISGLLYVVSAYTSNIVLFAFSRALHGFSMGIFFPSSLSTAVDLAPPGRVGETLGWRGMMFSLGNIIGPALGGYLSDYLGFAGAFSFVSLFSLLGAGFVIPVWKEVGRITGDEESSGGSVSYRALLKVSFVFTSLALLFFSASYSGITTYLPAFYKYLGFPQRTFGLYMMVVGASSFATRLVGGKTADRIGPVPVSFGGILVVITGYVFLNYRILPPESYISAVLIGAGFGLSVPAMQMMALAPLPGKIRAMGSSIYTMFFDLGTLGGQVALGYVADLRGYEAVFPLLPFIAGVALISILITKVKGEGNA
ncbi:predicted permease, major facilitator superfamily [Thermococcus kodakarensis KOD1]|uniref:Predicted permease, major facilitator superfamily n=1 Tax=Thermococcus kodakarensis (strain ATCC BAA-918 / JCM 12380 / KOD1) TaxID=69014 RepID=Q5JHT0_THEKO|nr:MFS transporter [Thermococcus kodakarensis]WCN28075.1 MFS transporter [Thermococcus kodakarensis]WCN30372.1 MFS transporter [Thermococcus kodakarensis]BAD86436.1 predicted permease, major facilitator superfamily [Thermococcus kodakarensis KOD1]